MLKTAHDAEEFMRTGARVSPSWPGGDLRGRIRCSRLISRRSRQNPLQTGRAIRFQQYLTRTGRSFRLKSPRRRHPARGIHPSLRAAKNSRRAVKLLVSMGFAAEQSSAKSSHLCLLRRSNRPTIIKRIHILDRSWSRRTHNWCHTLSEHRLRERRGPTKEDRVRRWVGHCPSSDPLNFHHRADPYQSGSKSSPMSQTRPET